MATITIPAKLNSRKLGATVAVDSVLAYKVFEDPDPDHQVKYAVILAIVTMVYALIQACLDARGKK
jgi:hypothetical protein